MVEDPDLPPLPRRVPDPVDDLDRPIGIPKDPLENRRKAAADAAKAQRNAGGSHKDDDADSDSSKSDAESLADGDSDEYYEEDTSALDVYSPSLELYRRACDFSTYRLKNKNARYNGQDAKRMKSYLRDCTIQMKGRHFDNRSPISVLNFLATFKRSCDINRVHEGAAFYLIANFISGVARTDFDSQLNDGPAPEPDDFDVLSTYCGAINYLLRTYATNETIAAAHGELVAFRQAPHMSAKAYGDRLLSKAGRCGRVYPRRVVRGYFVEGVLDEIRPAVRDYLAAHPKAHIHDLINHAETMSRVAGLTSRASSQSDRSTPKHDNQSNRQKNNE